MKQPKKLTDYISFAIPEDSDINNLAGKIPSLEYFENGFERIFPEQIRSAWNVMVSLIDGKTHEHVTGLTQLGKNGLITVLLDFLGVVAFAKDTTKDPAKKVKVLVPVAWLPNAINMEKQSIEKFRQSMLLNGIIRCHIKKQVKTLNELHGAINNKTKDEIIKSIENGGDSETVKTKSKKLVDDFFTEETSALVLRRSMAKDHFYRWLFNGAKGSERKIVLIMDESHIAIGKDQGADKILSKKQSAYITPKKQSGDLGEDPVDKDFNAEKTDIEQEKSETKEIVNTYQEIFKGEAKLVTISATNLPFNVLKYQSGEKPVYLEVADGYCGFPFVDGEDYPIGKARVHPPIVKSISQIANDFKLPDLEFLNLRTLDHAYGFGLYIMNKDWQKICRKLNDNIEVICGNLAGTITGDFDFDGRGINRAAKVLGKIKVSRAREIEKLFDEILRECEMSRFLSDGEFAKLFTGKSENDRTDYLGYLSSKKESRLEVGWNKAIKTAQRSLGDLLEYLLITKNPQMKKGCILRWECLNDSYNDFIKELAVTRFKDKICFIPYMEESAKSTVSEILKTSNPRNLPYLISVTGRGRYGESYPRDCGYAIDCTTKNSTAASFFQSLLGRLTGYGKYDLDDFENTLPLLILSDIAYEKVFLELLNGKGWSPKVGTGKDLVKTGLDFKPIEKICIDRGSKELEPLFNSIDAELAKFPNATFRQLHSKIEIDLFDLISPFCILIEKSPQKFVRECSGATSLEILRPGQRDEKDREYDWEGRKDDEENRPEDARTFVAYEQKKDSKKFGLDSNRNRSGKQFLHVGFQTKEIGEIKQLQSLWLWLKTPIQSSVTGPTDGAVGVKPGTVPGNLPEK